MKNLSDRFPALEAHIRVLEGSMEGIAFYLMPHQKELIKLWDELQRGKYIRKPCGDCGAPGDDHATNCNVTHPYEYGK